MTSNLDESKGLTHLLELIRACNENIIYLLNSGESEESLIVRQEKHLKNTYCNDLNKILQEYNLGIRVTETKRRLPKAA